MKRAVVCGALLAVLLLLIYTPGRTRGLAGIQALQGLTFVRQSVDSISDSTGTLVAGRVDGDQDQDLIGIIAESGVYQVVWWENDGTPASGEWSHYDIGTSTTYISMIDAADIDNDLDLDVVMTSNQGYKMVWFENDGTPSDGAWSQHTIGTAKPFDEFGLADVDGDLDMDVVVNTNYNRNLQWYENDGTPGDGIWASHMVLSICDECNSVRTVDMDHNNLPDILVTAFDDNLQDYDTLYFLINNGAGSWTRHVLEEAPNITKADAGDIDGDGDVDVVAALQGGAVRWYENNGGSGVTWPHWTVVPTSLASAGAIHLVDLDQDHDLDILVSSYVANEIVWLENDGTPLDGPWTEHVIEAAYVDPGWVNAADIDDDGDLDVIGETEGGVFWWELTATYPVYLPAVIR